MADQQTPDATALTAPPRRTTTTSVATAIDLGWRVAALYALRPTTLQPPSPVSGDMLLNRRSLAPGDRLELEVLAIEGVARSVGVAIWRQILTGDKEPEAWISHAKRAEVRDEVTKQVWRRYRRHWWLLPLLAGAGFGAALLYAEYDDLATGLIGSALALAGTVGLTRATMIGALKKGAQQWGDLMWNRALAAVICRETSVIEQLYPAVRRERG